MISARLEVNWYDYRQFIDTMNKAKAGFEALDQSATVGSTASSKPARSSGRSSKVADPMDDPKIQQEVIKLQLREKEVIAHEQAHKAVGGQYAGAASYTYTQGPDGKNYISGGEVTIDVSEEKKPEDTIPKMQQVRAAALAPAQPSPQDMSVASTASQKEAAARIEVLRQQNAVASEKTDNTTEKTNGPEKSEPDTSEGTQIEGANGIEATNTQTSGATAPTLDTGGSAFGGYAIEAYGRSDQAYSTATSNALSVFA